MRFKKTLLAASSVTLAAVTALGAGAAFAGTAPAKAAQSAGSEQAFLNDLAAATGNPKAIKNASAADKKKIITAFKQGCSTPAAQRKQALNNPILDGKISKADRNLIADSWEKNVCKG